MSNLTPAEIERLAMLAEECGEVIQIVGKILRFGYESYHPENPTVTNRDLLLEEITDIMAVTGLLTNVSDIGDIWTDKIQTAMQKKLRLSRHQGDS